MRPKSPTGIRVRHARSCPVGHSPEARCKCRPSYEAFVFSVRDGKKLRRTFPSLAAAKAWRHDASTTSARAQCARLSRQRFARRPRSGLQALATARSAPAAVTTVQAERAPQLSSRCSAGASSTSSEQRSSATSRGATCRTSPTDYSTKGLDPSTIRNALMPLRAIYRRALARGEVAVNPMTRHRASRRPRPPRPDRLARRGRDADRGPSREATALCGRPRCTPGSAVAS